MPLKYQGVNRSPTRDLLNTCVMLRQLNFEITHW